MKERVIFHIDINHCYAQIEEMMFPGLRNVSMAVGGHEEKRHGIILAKNDIAKAKGIKTGESLRDARKKDPDILIIPPHYDEYVYYTTKVKKIYEEYSDHVESFGMDEAWIDYTDSAKLFGDPIDIAYEIQRRVLDEVGLTVSVGVSWNKVFAKLGSDLIKPSGMVVITKDNYKDVVWPLPVEDLLYVGPATTRKLHSRGILTIGELAGYPVHHLKNAMGVVGEMIHAFANGNDPSRVYRTEYRAPVKSVGNSITMVRDVATPDELRPVYYVLAEAVASRLRGHGMEGDVISISMRNADMEWMVRERRTDCKTNCSEEIFRVAEELISTYDYVTPLRAVGLSVSHLVRAGSHRQLSLFRNEEQIEKARRSDIAMDEIRERYGFYAVRRGCTLLDRELTEFNVKEEHTIHPVGYFQGRKIDPHGT